MSVTFLSRTRPAICSMRRVLFTMNGISRMMMRSRPSRPSSMSAFARITTRPRPCRYASRIPAPPKIAPPVGKSGPRTISINSSSVVSGASMRR